MQSQQLQAKQQTLRQVAAIQEEIMDIYDGARLAVSEQLEQLYSEILAGLDPDDYNTVLQTERFKRILKDIERKYIAEAAKVGDKIEEASRLAMTNAYYKNAYILDFFSGNIGASMAFAGLPDELVQVAVTNTIAQWSRIESERRAAIIAEFGSIDNYKPKYDNTLINILLSKRRAEARKIRRAIVQGLAAGDNFRQVSKKVGRVIGEVFKAGATGAKASAIRIVRTETNRIYNAGQYASAKAADAQGLPIRRRILATLDTRTRAQSAQVDAQTVGVDDPFIYPGGVEVMYPGNSGVARWDINDRESVTTVIEGVEPTARIGINPQTGETQTFKWQNYREWAESNGLRELPSGRWAL